MQGTRIGPYVIESPLGSGGMGTVWRAVVKGDAAGLEPGTPIAIKIIHPHLLETPGYFKRFLREAEIGRTVLHENVVRTYDADALLVRGQQQNFLVMEYVEGQTLRALLEELERVPEELCRHIAREVACGLDAIHEAGAVHRDLKPENVLITPQHAVKIMDLGMARLADEAIRLSRTGSFVGSICYAAPEQIERGGDDIDGRADLYALGLLLYELASGQHPHLADDAARVIHKLLEVEPRRLGDLEPQLSPFFEEVVHELLMKDRGKRFASARELLEVLSEGERSAWWPARGKTIQARTRRPLRRIRIPRETAVYGREDELARLETLHARAKEGNGGVVLIEGEAGIGKTRLVDELVGRLRQRGEDLNFLFGSYPPGGAATASGAWSTAYREHFGAEGLEETLESYLTVTPTLIPAFSALLRGEPPPKGDEPLTPDSLQTVFIHVTRALAQERPTLVLIEDLHFAPEEGRGVFASLALAVPEHPILLVGTARPGIPEGWRADLERLDQTCRMELRRLGPKDLGQLLIDALRSERLATELGLKIATKSDGNPFFVFEIIRGLREGKFITRGEDGSWIPTRVIQDIRIPSSIQDLIQARIADLDEEEQELLDMAACCGFTFDGGLVAEALGIPRIPALRRLGHLERSHRLVRATGPRYVFDHHQVQETLHAGLAEPLRKEYHAAVGRALQVRHPTPDGAVCVDLCEHLLRAGQGEKAVPHLTAALRYLEAGHLIEHAVSLARHALGAPDVLGGRERIEILLDMAAGLDLRGRREEERAALDEALALTEEIGDLRIRARVLRRLGVFHMYVSRYDRARETLLAAVDLARQVGDEMEEAVSTGHLGTVFRVLARYEESREHHERHLEIARRIGDRRGEGQATMMLGLGMRALGRLEEAREHQARALTIFRETGDRRGEARATGNLGSVLIGLDRLEEARERLERSLEIVRDIGDRRGEGQVTGNLGSLLFMLGRNEDAREHQFRRLAIAREIGDRVGEAHAVAGLGLIERAVGRYGEARDRFTRWLEIASAIGDRRNEGEAAGSLGTLRLALGDGERARADLERWLTIARETGNRLGEGQATRNLGVLFESLGEREAARQHYQRAHAIAEENDNASEAAAALVRLGELHLADGRFEEARDSLQDALSRARSVERHGIALLATCLLAVLPGGDAPEATAAFAAWRDHLKHDERMRARFLLWRATGDPAHLERAHLLLGHLRDHAPEECRETMIRRVPLHREIAAAWKKRPGERA